MVELEVSQRGLHGLRVVQRVALGSVEHLQRVLTVTLLFADNPRRGLARHVHDVGGGLDSAGHLVEHGRDINAEVPQRISEVGCGDFLGLNRQYVAVLGKVDRRDERVPCICRGELLERFTVFQEDQGVLVCRAVTSKDGSGFEEVREAVSGRKCLLQEDPTVIVKIEIGVFEGHESLQKCKHFC